MRSLRYIFLLVKAFLFKFKNLIILGVAIGMISFFILKLIAPLIIPGPTETIGVVGKYRLESLPNDIVNLVGEGLTKIDENGIVLPALASSWETTDKGQTWIFHLNKNILWQDGKKVIASQISYKFTDATVETPDDATIIFKLQSPFAPFPAIVSQPVFKTGLLGTGEWEVKRAVVAGTYVQRLTLENKNGDRKIFKFFPTEERSKLAFKLGSVNKLQDIFSKEPFDSWKTTKITETIDFNRFVGIFFNTQDKLLGEKTLRQALSYAIDKSNLGGPRAYSPISPNSWAYNSQVKPYDFDESRSKDLIADLPEELRNSLSIKLVTTPVLLSVGETIIKSWKQIGIEAEIQVTSGAPTEYQALLAIFDIPKDPDQYALWHSTQTATNISKYQNPRIDKLLEDGRVQLIQEERRKIYLDFQRFLVEDSPAIFLYHPTSFTIEKK